MNGVLRSAAIVLVLVARAVCAGEPANRDDGRSAVRGSHSSAEVRSVPPRSERAMPDVSTVATTHTADPEADELVRVLRSLQARVSQHWLEPASYLPTDRAVLRIELEASGVVAKVSVVQSSGNADFDRSAVDAVRAAGRFDVPTDPQMFERDFRIIHFGFSVKDSSR